MGGKKGMVVTWLVWEGKDRLVSHMQTQCYHVSTEPHNLLYLLICSLIMISPQSGYESLCCLRCIQPRDTNFGTTCICRVPKSKLESVS